MRRSEPEEATISITLTQRPAPGYGGSWKLPPSDGNRSAIPTADLQNAPPDHPHGVSHSSHHPDDETMTDRLDSTRKGGLITNPNRSH